MKKNDRTEADAADKNIYFYALLMTRLLQPKIKMFLLVQDMKMTLWKQNFLICLLVAGVTFEILSLWNYALHETIVSLPDTVLKIICSNFVTLHLMTGMLANLSLQGTF